MFCLTVGLHLYVCKKRLISGNYFQNQKILKQMVDQKAPLVIFHSLDHGESFKNETPKLLLQILIMVDVHKCQRLETAFSFGIKILMVRCIKFLELYVRKIMGKRVGH